MPSNQTTCNNCGCTPNPLDSGNWESESTAGRSATPSTTPAEGSPSVGPVCEIGFKDKTVCKLFSDKIYDAGLNVDTNCQQEEIIWGLEGSIYGATVDSVGVVTFGTQSEEFTVTIKCGEISDAMLLMWGKIDWIESEVTVPWYEQPSGVYDAQSNVDLEHGGWMPDTWGLENLDSGEIELSRNESSVAAAPSGKATINSSTGKVTYGSEGEHVYVSGSRGRCPMGKSAFLLKILKLAIYRGDEDVTNKTITVFAGETVSLRGVVTPAQYSGDDWQWTVPEITIKDFEVSADFKNGTRIDYTAADWKSQQASVHWVDGDPEGILKNIQVSATVAGLRLTAYAAFKVRRPSALINVRQDPPDIRWIAGKSAWIYQAHFFFTHQEISIGGRVEWIQVGRLMTRWKNTDGSSGIDDMPPVEGNPPAQPVGVDFEDGEYPYSKADETADHPGGYVRVNVKNKTSNYIMKMWLMWHSPKEGVIVPISSVDWWFEASVESVPPLGRNGRLDKPVWTVPPDANNAQPTHELIYPEWSHILET